MRLVLHLCMASLSFLGELWGDFTGVKWISSGTLTGTHSTMFVFLVVQKHSSPIFLSNPKNAYETQAFKVTGFIC